MNYFKVYGLAEHARKMYAGIRRGERKSEGAGECTECGACLEKCPQDIDIIAQLKETEAALGE